MARYIDVDALIERIERDVVTLTKDADEAKAFYIRFLSTEMYAPTADVVPKSEYDAVVSAVDNSTKEFLKLHDAYQNAKAEVAREIFEDIARLLMINFCSCLPSGATEHYDYFEGELADDIAELKKKYTGEET